MSRIVVLAVLVCLVLAGWESARAERIGLVLAPGDVVNIICPTQLLGSIGGQGAVVTCDVGPNTTPTPWKWPTLAPTQTPVPTFTWPPPQVTRTPELSYPPFPATTTPLPGGFLRG